LPLLDRKPDRSWRETIEKNVKDRWEVLKDRAMHDANPINPQRVFWELSPRLPEKCIIVCDRGSGTNSYACDVKIRRGMMASVSGSLATMGLGIPYGIAAKFACPDGVVLALCGDGALQMNGMNELLTVAKYWRKWSDPRLVLAPNNRDLNQVTWEVRAMAGNLESEQKQPGRPLGYPAGPLLAWVTAVGLLGTVAEAALLLLRGAFHNPFMFLPVTLPPLAAVALALAAIRPEFTRWAKSALLATVAMRVASAGFHAYGVSRSIGGFNNWSQNLLNGPPLPAPPAFSGAALAGLAAVELMEAR
jgi:hypothetical protein